ncbi:hypothetical protein [Kineosporia sp. A_224]|uniref:hypothetical protein n=1 Tax=Kineosporia sp. A_224 TaxID=1962180 RepID=UPI00117B2669|nr:hypothetical protein [Kineosporia sp. A_224]
MSLPVQRRPVTPRRPERAVALVLLCGALGLGYVTLQALAPPPQGAPAPAPTVLVAGDGAPTAGCGAGDTPGPADDPTYCERLDADRRSRDPVDPGRVADLRHDRARVAALLAPPYGPPPEHTPEDVLVTLRAAGFRQSQARPARTDDPAPAGSLVYAVQVPGGCLVGSLAVGDAGRDDGPTVVGTLPDRSCLAL